MKMKVSTLWNTFIFSNILLLFFIFYLCLLIDLFFCYITIDGGVCLFFDTFLVAGCIDYNRKIFYQFLKEKDGKINFVDEQ